MEILGAFLCIDTNRDLYRCFRWHYSAWFPALKRLIAKPLCTRRPIGGPPNRRCGRDCLNSSSMIPRSRSPTAFPSRSAALPALSAVACIPGRRHLARRKGARQTYWGLQAYVRLYWPEVITGFRLAPANVHELQVAEEIFEGVSGWVLRDRSFVANVILSISI